MLNCIPSDNVVTGDVHFGCGVSNCLLVRRNFDTTGIVSYSSFYVLLKVGGSLGLWLGLGALQASELFVKFTMILVEKIRTRTGLSRT